MTAVLTTDVAAGAEAGAEAGQLQTVGLAEMAITARHERLGWPGKE